MIRSASDFLPSGHDLVDDLLDEAAAMRGVGLDRANGCAGATGHLLLDAVARARLLAVGDAGGVERAADDLVANAREVLDAAAANEDDRVLLKVVALARDVAW